MSSSKGVSDFDRTHRAVANFGYEIPKFGFGLNNTASVSASSPLGCRRRHRPIWNALLDHRQRRSRVLGAAGSSASHAPGATLKTAVLSGSPQSRLNAYFNTAAFTRPGNFFGNVGRNTVRPRTTEHRRLGRQTHPHNRACPGRIPRRVLLRAKRSELRIPSGAISSSGFGVIKATEGNPRVVQFGLKIVF